VEPTGIGNTLRDARNRRKIDLSEVEDAIKIRVRFLRAMENEEWDVLPGDIYTRAFIKTYASYLGLDGERLAEDYRESSDGGGAPERPALIEPALSGRRLPGRPGLGGRVLAVVVVAALIGILVAIGLATGGDNPSGEKSNGTAKKGRANGNQAKAAAPGVAVSLEATDEVWVCMLDAGEKPVINGLILGPGEQEGPFRSREFSMAFGNGSVEMEINGRPAHLPESSSPIGFAVDEDAHLTELQEGERPECA
jgi:cytoskeleton protein RodZ